MNESAPFRNVLITGATSGIGEALAHWMADHGATHIFFCGRDPARLHSVAAALSARGCLARPQLLDVADCDATRAWIEACDAEAPLDLVHANAGVSTGGREDEEDAVRRTFAINVGGVLNTVYPAIDLFRKPDDPTHPRAAKRIAITASLTGYHGMPQCPAYSASKACVKALGAALRGRLRREGIAVTTLCPGFVRSRITDQNTCRMPFFWEAPRAADRIGRAILAGKGLITFPWPMRLGMWALSSLPETWSEAIFRALPEKTDAR